MSTADGQLSSATAEAAAAGAAAAVAAILQVSSAQASRTAAQQGEGESPLSHCGAQLLLAIRRGDSSIVKELVSQERDSAESYLPNEAAPIRTPLRQVSSREAYLHSQLSVTWSMWDLPFYTPKVPCRFCRLAASMAPLECIEELINSGASATARSEIDGWTAFHVGSCFFSYFACPTRWQTSQPKTGRQRPQALQWEFQLCSLLLANILKSKPTVRGAVE